jgi:hypothetical protein
MEILKIIIGAIAMVAAILSGVWWAKAAYAEVPTTGNAGIGYGGIDDAGLKGRPATLIDDAAILTEFARDWRNRHIAHRDLKLALEQASAPLADASREDVKKALSATAAVLNEVAAHYTDSQTAFDFGGPLGGSVSLLYVLGIGSRAREERRGAEQAAHGRETDG